MIYWVLHKPFCQADLNSQIEGYPGYMFEHLKNIVFLDITGFSLCERLEFGKKNRTYQNLVDLNQFGNRYIRIADVFSLKRFLATVSLSDSFIVQDIGRINIQLFITALNKKKIKPLLLNHWRIPDGITFSSAKKEKKNLSYFLSLRKTLIKKIVYKWTERNIVFPLQLGTVFSCGNRFNDTLSAVAQYDAVVKCHSVSYDEFLTAKKQVSVISPGKPFIVFVDQALTIHPDNANHFSKEFSDSYHKEILKALRYLREREQLEIIIAQHPRIQYAEGYWEEFETRSGQTQPLIRQAKKIVGHFSTALLNAMYEQKEIILLTSSSPHFPFTKKIHSFFECLGNELIDMTTLQSRKLPQNRENAMTDFFSLIPEETSCSNKEIITNIIRNL
mgnify:FL=1